MSSTRPADAIIRKADVPILDIGLPYSVVMGSMHDSDRAISEIDDLLGY